EQIRGARMSIWPDDGTPDEAENTTEERMAEPMRLVAQATWATTTPWDGSDEFLAAMDAVGRTPLTADVDRPPVADGSYRQGYRPSGTGLTMGECSSVDADVSAD